MRTRWYPVLAVLVLSPVCAEYLSAYDVSSSSLSTLLGGLLVLGPLYGAPALLAREVVVRRGLGWPGLLLVATALGVLQAVVIDQSVVNPVYRDFDGWSDLWRPTYVPALDLSAYAAVAFTLGHTVASFGAPLAVVTVVSRDGGRPWLGRWSVPVLALLYVTAACLVLGDHLSAEGWQLSVGQVVGVAALSWALFRWGADPAWTNRHVAALAVGVLLSRALGGFLVDPVDGGRTLATSLVNVGAVLLVLALAALTWRATRGDHRARVDPSVA